MTSNSHSLNIYPWDIPQSQSTHISIMHPTSIKIIKCLPFPTWRRPAAIKHPKSVDVTSRSRDFTCDVRFRARCRWLRWLNQASVLFKYLSISKPPGGKSKMCPSYPKRVVKGDLIWRFLRITVLKGWPNVGAWTGTLQNPMECLWHWAPDRRYYFS